jgi:tetratricopeptide (TPR) repeat protein
VQFAHRNLIVHRDLKPQNILVTSDGQVKLLDFGIAKILTESFGSAATVSGRMTPQYASPEQLKGEPITTASDIYSLGLVLYELLTGGRRPFEMRDGNVGELVAAICSHDAPPPSALTTGDQSKRLHGELDNLVLKTLAKEPSRRYNSVEQLEEDISRYRTGLPLLAQGDALGYRFGKFVRRRRGWVAAAAVVCVSICGGVIATLSEAKEARRQQALAEKRYNDVRSLATTILFDIHDSIKSLAGSTPARQLAIRKGLDYLEALAGDSRNDPNLQAELAAGYERAGSLTGSLFDSNTEGGRAAAPILERALELRKKVVAARPRDADAHAALAMSYLMYGNSQAATANAGAARDTYRLALALPLAPGEAMRRARGQLQSQLCNVTAAVADASEAVPVCQEAVRLAQDLVRSNPRDHELARLRAIGHGRLANVLRVTGRYQEATPHFRLALEEMQALQDQQPSDSNLRHMRASLKVHLAYTLEALGDRSLLSAFADAIQGLEASLSEDPQDSRRIMVLAYALERYSAVLDKEKRGKEAEAAYERGLSFERKMAAKPTAGAYELNNLAAALAKCPYPRLRDPDLAVELAKRANELTNGTAPGVLHTLAMAYLQNGQAAKAVETSRRALSLVPAAQGPSTGIRKLLEEMLAESESASRRRAR